MKPKQSLGTRPVHQTVARAFQFKGAGKSIAIGFTDQRLSPQAGSATFWGWLRGGDWLGALRGALPQALPLSNNHLLPIEKALAFIHGLLCDARKLTHVAYLRRDPVAAELIGVRRVASPSVLARFFQGFDSAGTNLRCFRRLWHWSLDRLPSAKTGYTLDLDSTRLLHEDGHQEGVAVGYTRAGLKPCLHPLLAVLAEVRLVAQLWLRPRQHFVRRQRHGFLSRSLGEPAATPSTAGRAGGRGLLPARTPGVMGRVAPALCGRGAVEPADTKAHQRRFGVAAHRSAGHRGRRVGAALSLATLTYNLTVLFQRHLGWQQKVTIHSLRFWLFVTAGVLSYPRGQTTIKRAVPLGEREWWRRLWPKILSPLPNCNAVENRPAFTGSSS